MSTYLLFCVAQIPATIIDALLQTPRHNLFSLVRDPSQTAFDQWHTKPPVTTFESGFSGYSSGFIRDFIALHLPETPPRSNLDPGQYALLDERSAHDNTVIIGHSYSTLLDRDPEGMTEDELDEWTRECDEYDDEGGTDDAWREWRVRFEDAEKLTTSLSFESDFTPKLYRDDFVAAHTNSVGIFQLQDALRAYEESAVELSA